MLQLLSNYYKSVIESERIYNEYLLKEKERADQVNGRDKEKSKTDTAISTPNTSDLVTLQLQTQVNKLTSQIQTLTKQNDKLKDTSKSQRITSEEKIKNLKSMIKDLQDKITEQSQSSNGSSDKIDNSNSNNVLSTPRRGSKNDNNRKENDDLNNEPRFHLLSPWGKNMPNGSRGSSHTIFDDSTSESDLNDSQLNLDTQLSSSKDKSNETDTFILSLKKYDQVNSNVKLEKILNDESGKPEGAEEFEKPTDVQRSKLQEKKQQHSQSHKNIPTKPKRNKRKLRDKRRKNAVKDFNDITIPKLNKEEPSFHTQTGNKKRKLSRKKIQITSDNESLLPLGSQ